MYIEKVEILGFKSFARKIELMLGPGICVIMGPNGCGKTNILDAIRWAIGEQKMSLLRSSVLEDVIFNGSQARKAFSFAEVTVQIAECQGLLSYDPTADRVNVGRYITRNGDSQFFINGQPVRLKDVRSVLGTVGLIDTGYAVMEQEMMKRILINSEDRKLLFEQAAGIAKYKSDKHAALSRLQSAEEDLIKLDNIISEVEEQEKQLRQQSARAKRYAKIKEKILQLYSALFSSKLGSIDRKMTELNVQKKEITAQIELLDTELISIRTQRNTLATQAEELRRKIEGFRSEVAALVKTLHSNEKEDAVLSERIENATSNIERIRERRKQTCREIEENELKLQEAGNSLRIIRQRKNEMNTRYTDLEKQLDSVNEKVSLVRDKIEELVTLENKCRGNLLELQNKIGFSKNEEGILSSKIAKLSEQEKIEIENYSRICDERKNILRKMEEVKAQEKYVIDKIDNLKDNLEKNIERTDELNEKIGNIEKENAEISGRLLELERILKNESVANEKVNILRKKKEWKTVSDLFTVDNIELAKLLALALGEKQGFLVVPDRKSALDVIEEIESGSIGFIILDELDVGKSWDNVIADDERIWSVLDGFYPIENGVQKKGEIRVSKGECELMPTPIVAKALRKRLIQKFTKNKSELESYKKELCAIAPQLENIETQIRNLEMDREKLNQEIKDLDTNIARCEHNIKSSEANLKNIRSERIYAEERRSEILKNIAEWEKLSALETQTRQRLEKDVEKARVDLAELQNKRAELERKISALAIEIVGVESELRNCEKDIGIMKETVENLAQEIKDMDMSEEEMLKSIDIAMKRKSDIAKAIEEISEKIDAISDSIEQLEEKRNEQERCLKELEENERKKNSKRVELENSLLSVEKELSACETEFEQLSIRAQEILKYIPEFKETHSFDQEQIWAKKIERLQHSLDTLGPVNFEAEQSYNKVKEKLNRLLYQKNDVLTSVSDLRKTVSRLDREAQERFLATFDEARKNFAEIFQKLFNGGDADLVLESPNEPLMSDIKIICCPPGKKVLSLNQFSAGEKALIALSLLFGLYLIKPSPFCLMDEVDAPLDEVNTDRFLALIREFSEKIQFIIVSHNPKTLENSDFLYGVSMEQEGISRVFSIKMADQKLGLQWR